MLCIPLSRWIKFRSSSTTATILSQAPVLLGNQINLESSYRLIFGCWDSFFFVFVWSIEPSHSTTKTSVLNYWSVCGCARGWCLFSRESWACSFNKYTLIHRFVPCRVSTCPGVWLQDEAVRSSHRLDPDAQVWAKPDARLSFWRQVLVNFFSYRMPVHQGSLIELRPCVQRC
jgi:hypothetical protein